MRRADDASTFGDRSQKKRVSRFKGLGTLSVCCPAEIPGTWGVVHPSVTSECDFRHGAGHRKCDSVCPTSRGCLFSEKGSAPKARALLWRLQPGIARLGHRIRTVPCRPCSQCPCNRPRESEFAWGRLTYSSRRRRVGSLDADPPGPRRSSLSGKPASSIG
jgi:hypothetical protein